VLEEKPILEGVKVRILEVWNNSLEIFIFLVEFLDGIKS